jgi:hypothetical protein
MAVVAMVSIRERIASLTSDDDDSRNVREAVGDTARKARQDLRAADRATFDARKAARQGLSTAAATLSDAELTAGDVGVDDTRTQSVAERAERAGEARPPVDATLNMAGEPRAIESMAAAGGGIGSEPPATDQADDADSGGGMGLEGTASMEAFVMGRNPDDRSGSSFFFVGDDAAADDAGSGGAAGEDGSDLMTFEDTWFSTGSESNGDS